MPRSLRRIRHGQPARRGHRTPGLPARPQPGRPGPRDRASRGRSSWPATRSPSRRCRRWWRRSRRWRGRPTATRQRRRGAHRCAGAALRRRARSGGRGLRRGDPAAAGHPGLRRARQRLAYAWRSFEMYPLLAQVAGARAVQVPLVPGAAGGTADTHDLDGLLAAVDETTRVVLVCNPNNPTGTAVRGPASRRSSTRCPRPPWWCSTRPTASSSPTPRSPTAPS